MYFKQRKNNNKSLISLNEKIIPSSESYTNLSSYSIILNRPFSKKIRGLRKLSLQSTQSKMSDSTQNPSTKIKNSEIEDVNEKENELNLSQFSDFNLEDEEEEQLSFDSSFDDIETASFDEEALLKKEIN